MAIRFVVDNLPLDISNGELMDIFSKLGQVIDIRAIENVDQLEHKWAFVDMEDGCEEILAACDGRLLIGGRRIALHASRHSARRDADALRVAC